MARFEFNTIDQFSAGQSASGDILFELGVMYAAGREVKADLVEAHKWLNIAAHRGSSAAARYRRELAAEMTSAEVAAAQRLAREWIALN